VTFASEQESRQTTAAAEPIDEVIVTARKIEENVQDVPMSVQVLDAALLDVTNPTAFLDLQYAVPGLVVNNLGLNGSGFSLRGIADQGGSGVSVATHMNGVYLGSTHLAAATLFDLERIEALKGPQGTLYGRNATGGSINLVPQSPEPVPGAGVEGAWGSFDTLRVKGHVNVPFDQSAVRVAFAVSGGDGYIRNSVDGRRFAEKDFRGLRVSYRADVTDRLSLDLMAQRVEDDGAIGELWLPRPDFLADPSDIRLATVTQPNPFLDISSTIASANLEFDLGFATLRSISGYAHSKAENLDDCAGLPILAGCIRSVMPLEHRQVSQELRLASLPDEGLSWLAGLYVYDADGDRRFYQLTPTINPEPTSDSFNTTSDRSVAAFGQAAWRLDDRWTISAGLRLSRDRQNATTIGSGTEDSPTGARFEDTWTNDNWRVEVEYQADAGILLYSSVATGHRPGGITFLPGGIPDPFGPEHLTAFESGVKISQPDGPGTLNVAAFVYDFHDMQVSTATITEDGLIFETDNAAKAEIVGVDAEGELRLGERLSLSAGVVWLPKREFVSYRNDLAGDTLSGNLLTRAPEWTVATAIDYVQPLAGLGNLNVRFEYHYRSSFFYTVDNNPLFAQGSFGLLNTYLQYEPAGGRWYAFASGRNLGGVDYMNQVFLQSSPGYPDTYEAGFGYRF